MQGSKGVFYVSSLYGTGNDTGYSKGHYSKKLPILKHKCLQRSKLILWSSARKHRVKQRRELLSAYVAKGVSASAF